MKTSHFGLLALCHEIRIEIHPEVWQLKRKLILLQELSAGKTTAHRFAACNSHQHAEQCLRTLKEIYTSSPPPKQAPLMAATTGFVDFSSFSNILCPSCDNFVTSSGVLQEAIMLQ